MHEQLLAVKKQRSAAVSAREAAEFARNRDFCIQASKRKDAEAEEKSLIVVEALLWLRQPIMGCGEGLFSFQATFTENAKPGGKGKGVPS